ncbi:GAF domain-containing protein [Shouchella plakortidis]|uniref:GAF domain-containing protein n=1 Tax=Alkalicoccobacillus plakortidis TaxID=444060 RepID=A0ABT0XHR8_9BACI|nr:GAF domain-containing protein [Alkalicoccobacillus plakortidis]MCM2675300.1 GAF domain-containing protein [Alkalicoccobacillus plakortidis]
MNGVGKLFQNEEYLPLWDKVFFSEKNPFDYTNSFIFTLRTDHEIVSAKQIGPKSAGLDAAFTNYYHNRKNNDFLLLDEQYTYIESDQYVHVEHAPLIKVGLLTRMEPKQLQHLPNLLNWVEKTMFPPTASFMNVEQLLEASNYQIRFKPLIEALFRLNDQLQSPLKLILLERREMDFKHKTGWDHLSSSVIKLGEQKVSELLDGVKSSTNMIEISGEVTDQEQAVHTVIPLFYEETSFACIIASTDEQHQHSMNVFKSASRWLQQLLQKGFKVDRDENEAKKKDLLLEVTKKFYSTMDISEVLAKIVYAIKQTYPSFNVYLMLSHEWEVREELPIKPLVYGSEGMNTKAEHAFLTGMKQIEKNDKNQIVHLFMPLRGKQGIYGVLEIRATKDDTLPKEEISFIEILADTGGNALENAELYQQSRDLIHDLKLINKATHQINMNLNLNDLIKSMTHQIQEAFGAQEVGFFLFDRNDHTVIHQSGTVFFESGENSEQLNPLIQQLLIKKDPIYMGDTSLHAEIDTGPFRSLLAIPMLQKEAVHGAVFVFHQESYYFTFESFKLLQSLVHHSTLAFTNTLLHEELEKLVITDHLTSLHSRNHLEASMDQSILEHEKGTFLLIDIDNFKSINIHTVTKLEMKLLFKLPILFETTFVKQILQLDGVEKNLLSIFQKSSLLQALR